VIDLNRYNPGNLVPPEHQREALSVQRLATVLEDTMFKANSLEAEVMSLREENAWLHAEGVRYERIIKGLRNKLKKLAPKKVKKRGGK
tara:strand:- start:2 stop:265 length:264 start_codon:yes stop_codon:yes gene_type:complete